MSARDTAVLRSEVGQSWARGRSLTCESEGRGGRCTQSARRKQLGGRHIVSVAQFPGSSLVRGRNFGRSKDSDRVRIVIESLRGQKSMKSHGGIQGRHGRIGSLNLRCALRNASDSHHFGRIVRHTGRKCSRHEFNPRTLHIFRRGMPKGGSVVHSCRLAQEAEKFVQKWTGRRKLKAGVMKWPGGEIGAKMDGESGSSPGECEKMGRECGR